MARASGLQLLALAALCSSSAAQTSTVTQTPPPGDNGSTYYDGAENTWIEDDDRKVAQWAKEAVTRWCVGGTQGTVEGIEQAKEDIKNEVGDVNLIVKILEENATTEEDIQKIFQEHAGLAVIALPFLCMILTIIVWLFCCWSACCSCCRCCGKKRSKNLICSICQVIMMVVFFAACGVIYLGIDRAHLRVVDGVDNMLCASSQLLDTALSGQGTPGGFVGMMPVLEKFFYIEQQMKTNSPLLNEFDTILAQTADIETSVVLVSDNIKLLSDMLNDPQNMNPKDDSGNSLDHTCQLCQTLGPVVQELSTGLDEGIGNALNKARAEVQSQLTYSKRKDLMNAATSAAEPMMNAKKELIQILKTFVDPDAIKDEDKKNIEGLLWLVFLAISAVALLLVCCGCCSTACCLFRYESGGKPSTVAPRCACCVWCWSFLFLGVVFLLNGILNIVIFPSTHVCDVFANLDSPLLESIAQANSVNTTDDSFVMAKGLVDVCWVGSSTQSDNLLDMLFMRDANGDKEYMRQMLVSKVKTPIDAAFKEIQDRLANNSMKLADNQGFVDLTNLLATQSVKETLIPSTAVQPGGARDWASDADYQGLFANGAAMTTTSSALATSTACSDVTIEGNTLYGISNFVTILHGITGASAAGGAVHTCVEKATCPTGAPATANDIAACNAGNKFLDLKLKLLDGVPTGTKMFPCNVFRTQAGTACDPKDMTGPDGSGDYAGDCLRTHQAGYAFTEQENRTCDLDEFDTYIKDFSDRLTKSITRLDVVTADVFNVTVVNLRALVDKYFLNNIDEIADGISCGFLPPIKDKVVDGLCFQGLAGLKIINNMYLITALVVVVLAFDMYVLFRVMIDNATLDGKDGDSGSADQTI